MESKNLIGCSTDINTYYRSIFDKCDQDQNGRISFNELKTFMVKQNVDHTDSVFIEICTKADKNQDGSIDFNEFCEFVNDTSFNNTLKDFANKYVEYVVPGKLNRGITRTGLYEEECKCRPYVCGVIIISLVQVIIFHVDKQYNTDSKSRLALKWDPSKKKELWRFFSYMFVHDDYWHLYGNIVIQILIGLPLEMVHRWRVLVIYFAGVISGSLATSIIYPTDTLIGSSAGVWSFYSAHIASVLMNWSEMTYPLAQLLLFVTLTVLDPLYNYLVFKNSHNVSYIAHLAGALAGLLIGVRVLRNIRQTNMERIVWWIFVIIFSILIGYAIIHTILEFLSDT